MQAALRAALLLALLPACPASAGTAAEPYHDVVRLPPDAHGLAWHQVGGAVTPDELITEWVPEGQTDLDWTQIITIKTMARTRDPAAIVQGSVGLMRAICGKLSVVRTPTEQQFGDVQSLGQKLPVFDVTDLLVTCEDPNLSALRKQSGTENVDLRRYEVTWYRILRGERQNFIVQRAWHGDTIAADSVLGSNEIMEEWKHWLNSITLRRERTPK